jgi:hypothetical protein
LTRQLTREGRDSGARDCGARDCSGMMSVNSVRCAQRPAERDNGVRWRRNAHWFKISGKMGKPEKGCSGLNGFGQHPSSRSSIGGITNGASNIGEEGIASGWC